MTESEAIKVLKMVETHGALTPNAKELAIKALEKQIAKKPHHISEIDDNDNAMVECPICHANSDYSVNTIKSGYCWKCGQKLDWAEMQKG